jgi:hypothetical protein
VIESAADRLAMIRAVGGIRVSAERGTMDAIYDTADTAVEGPAVAIDSYGPRLTARTSDVRRLGLADGASVTCEHGTFTVRAVADDGTGMSVVALEAST